MKTRTGRIFQRGEVYWLRYTIDGKRFNESLDTKSERDAKVKAAAIMAPLRVADKAQALKVIQTRVADAETAAAVAMDTVNPPLTLAQVWNEYLRTDAVPAGKRTLYEYEAHWTAFWNWMEAHHPQVQFMRDVSPEIGESFIKSLVSRGLSGQRTNKYLQFLKSIFHELRKPARLGTNPFDEIRRRKQTGVSKRPLTTEEIRSLIESSDGELQTLFFVGTFTGLRLGDAATLRWDEVDMARGLIRRVPRKTAYKGKSAAVVVGIPAVLGKHLAGLQRRGPFVAPKCAEQYLRNPSVVAHWIQKRMEDCGIETRLEGTGGDTGKRGVAVAGFHSLRHFYISAQAQAGTPQAVLQKLAGHGNPMMTAHYTHVDDDTARSTASKMPALLSGEIVEVVDPTREPLPKWAVEFVEKMNAKNWKAAKAELLKGGAP